MAAEDKRVRAVLGGPLARLTELPVTPALLGRLGDCIIKALAREAKTYFAKRGWSGKDPMGGHPIGKSFSWRIRGEKTLEITSSFYGMAELAKGDIPSRRMTWATQQAKNRRPERYKLTRTEKKFRMKKAGRPNRGERLPLIVPIRTKDGTIEFRTAPLKMSDAWIHPGIAKFTFFETAIRKWRVRCLEVITATVADTLRKASR